MKGPEGGKIDKRKEADPIESCLLREAMVAEVNSFLCPGYFPWDSTSPMCKTNKHNGQCTVSMDTCIHAYVHTNYRMDTCIHAYVHTKYRMDTCIHAYVHTKHRMDTCIHASVHTKYRVLITNILD